MELTSRYVYFGVLLTRNIQISELQDTYPNMFDESRGNSRKVQEMGAEDLSRSIEDLRQKRVRLLGANAECIIM